MSVQAGPADWWTDNIDTGRAHMATKGIIQDGMVFNIDAGVSTSYPGSGTTWTNLASGAPNGTLVSGPTYTTAYGGGLTFNGTNTRIYFGTLSTSSQLSLTANFTIEQIFKPTAYSTSTYFGIANQLIAKGTASTYNYATQPSTDTTFSFTKRTNAEGLQYHTFTVPSMLNNVNVVSLVIANGDNTSIDTVTCYHNGNFIQTLSITGGLMVAYDNDPFYVGGGLGTTPYTLFTGEYYAGRIYNRALTSAEIKKNFNAIRGRYGI